MLAYILTILPTGSVELKRGVAEVFDKLGKPAKPGGGLAMGPGMRAGAPLNIWCKYSL